MTAENRIREELIKRGLNEHEATREAWNYINAIAAGEVEPETAESLGLTKEEIEKIYKL